MNSSTTKLAGRVNRVGAQKAVGLEKDGKFLEDEVKTCIDPEMIAMMKALQDAGDANKFTESLQNASERVRKAIGKARNCLAMKDPTAESLEEVALEISNFALQLGAKNILKSSIELQHVARCGASGEAAGIVQEIELEYLKVQQGLQGVV